MSGAGAEVTPDRNPNDFNLSRERLEQLVAQAREGDEADKKLTIRQALKQYKAPMAWAMFLSTSLIMEGFDLVTVRKHCKRPLWRYID